ALIAISSNINTKHINNLVVFNPSPWKRDGIVKALLNVSDIFSIHETETDNSVPYQIGTKKGELTEVYFYATSVPGVGYKTFYILNKKADMPLADVVIASTEDYSMENKYLKVRIEGNGSISVIDKITGRQFSQLAYFEDGADSGDTYNYSYPHEDRVLTSLYSKACITLVDRGPLLARFKIEISMNLPVALLKNRRGRSKKMYRFPIVTYVKLETNSPRLDFHTRIKNVVKDHRLRVIFPTNINACYSFSDRQFDVDESPVSFTADPQELPDNIKKIMIGARESIPGSNLPLRSFVYLKDKQVGAALLTHGLTEYEITEKHIIALTLFRSVGWLARNDLLTREGDAGPMIFTPEAQCLIDFDFNYSFLPFRNKTEGFPFKQADQENLDFKTVYTTKHKGKLENKRGLFCLDADKDQLVISAIKKAENEEKMIVRLFNPSTQDANGKFTFNKNIQKAEIVNLNEEFQSKLYVKKKSMALKIPLKKIMTLRLQYKPSTSVINKSLPGTRLLLTFNPEKINDYNVTLPVIVTKNDIIKEQKRADILKSKLELYRNKMEEVDKKIAVCKNEKKTVKLKQEKINIWIKITTLTRAELEARLSFILNQKKYVEFYESDKKSKNEKLNEYDVRIRELGYKLNTARVNKRVAEYIIEFLKDL
ncbi:hypothetical protein KJ656_15160, partial [bacterium]|nr:hypothetical protein [bacterium]